jgi:hypothetical protein
VDCVGFGGEGTAASGEFLTIGRGRGNFTMRGGVFFTPDSCDLVPPAELIPASGLLP